MTWAIAGQFTAVRFPPPGGPVVCTLLGQSLVGDLILVHCAASPGATGFLVGDNNPGGGNSYTDVRFDTTPDLQAQGDIFFATNAVSQFGMQVTVANGDGSPALYTVMVQRWRNTVPYFEGDASWQTGTSADPFLGGYHAYGLNNLISAWCVVSSQAVSSGFDPPLAQDFNVVTTGIVHCAHAIGQPPTGVYNLINHVPAVSDYYFGAVEFNEGPEPPPITSSPSAFFAGGIQPSPLYRIRKGGALTSHRRRRYRTNLLK